MKYLAFIDESGDPDLTHIEKDFSVFVLCVVLVEENNYSLVVEKVNQLKLQFFNSTNVILHSRDIRRSLGVFSTLNNRVRKIAFLEAINKLFSEIPISIVSSVIHKEKIKSQYTAPEHPYHLSLKLSMERLILFAENQKIENIDFIAESRNPKLDKELKFEFNYLKELGTDFITASRFQRRISKTLWCMKKTENEIGLQLSDLCAYPIARHAQGYEDRAFEIIQSKIIPHGLKIFP
jgi:hypothetical protein